MKLSDCIADYLNHIRYERQLAATTCLHYQCWLRHFTDWLTAKGSKPPSSDTRRFIDQPARRRLPLR